ncbi:hypothetical protein V8J88_04660 [Massilia sp. W12]|uniref:hypothetical protein n=1 Tax=Massilia sp. W12 TaxID=3126507 RepID=UPI0030D11B0D
MTWRTSLSVKNASLPYNCGMNDFAAVCPPLSLPAHTRACHVLLPFSLPPAELARDLLRDLSMPACQTLLSHARQHALPAAPDYARCLPHEAQLWQALFGPACHALPAATLAAHWGAAGAQDANAAWFVLSPVYLHIARDHLVLTDARQLALSEEHARALFASAQTLLQEEGLVLHWGDARHWLLRADAWRELDCASLDAACGHNIEIWLPKHAASQTERRWRKLQNEIQMAWFADPVNEARQESGLPPVNALWLWGGAAQPLQAQAPALQVRQGDALLQALAACTPPNSANLLLLDDSLSQHALAGDWGSWRAAFAALEASLFAPLLQQAAGRAIRLVLCDERQAQVWEYQSWRRMCFWRRPDWRSLLRALPQNTRAPIAPPAPGADVRDVL